MDIPTEYKITDITRDIVTTPVYPGDPEPELSAFSDMEKGSACNISVLKTGLHSGTHVDAPLHFLSKGSKINDYPPDVFIGECRVIEVPPGCIRGADVDRLFPKDTDRVLIKSDGKAYFDKTGAEEVAFFKIKLIGTDSNSVGHDGDQIGPHRAFLSDGVAILENLDLSEVGPGRYFLIALPAKIHGAEAAPARAVLVHDHLFWSR